MTVDVTHPDETRLVDFSMGRLNVAEREEIEQHLEWCNSCCAVLGNRSDSRDTLLELARQAAGAPVSAPTVEAVANIPPELMNHPRYRIISPLGEGGMGVVFKAEHKLMDRIVALKVISRSLTANEQAVDRFRREVRAAAKLGHANIVTAYEAEEVNGLLFLVMEYVEGVSLDRFAARQRNPIPVSMACHFIRQAALGLQHAHRRGMVHRDIKPQNLMLTRKGQIKILDFGLARLGEDPTPDSVSTPNLVVGTPDYLAPEQARNSHDVDIRADIYALGCTLYYLLARRVPFPGGSALDKMISHTDATPDPLNQLRPDVPPEVCAIVEKMMAKDKENRFQTPVDLANALAPYAKLGNSTATELVVAQPVLEPIFLDDPNTLTAAETEEMPPGSTYWPRPRQKSKSGDAKRQWLFPVLVASLLLFGGLIVYLATRDSKRNPPGDPARESAKNIEPRPRPKQPPISDSGFFPKGGLGGPKRDPRLPLIDSRTAKYKAMIVVPKYGLFYPDFEPVRQRLQEKGVHVSVVSLDWGQVQFFGNAPPKAVVQMDQVLTARDGFDITDFDAIICVGAIVDEFDPKRTAMKDWVKEGKRDPGAYLGELLKKMRDQDRVIASMCTGQAILHWNGIITTQRVATLNNDPRGYNLLENYPQAKWQGRQNVIRDGKLITASGPQQAAWFTDEIFKAIQGLPQ